MAKQSMMTEQEYDAAGNALINWFKSQGISPAHGSIIMLKLMASQLVAKSSKFDDLNRALKTANQILTLEVASELRRKP